MGQMPTGRMFVFWSAIAKDSASDAFLTEFKRSARDPFFGSKLTSGHDQLAHSILIHRRAFAICDNLAAAHHPVAVRDRLREVVVLLDEPPERFADVLDDRWLNAFSQLVESQQLRLAHQHATDRDQRPAEEDVRGSVSQRSGVAEGERLSGQRGVVHVATPWSNSPVLLAKTPKAACRTACDSR